MPSEKKTEFARLNQWAGNEYPKRQDFNDDNINIDKKLKELTGNLDKYETGLNNLGGIGRTNETVKGNAESIATLQNKVSSHLAESMPHKFIGTDGKTYRWGLSVVDGVPTMNYEEVI